MQETGIKKRRARLEFTVVINYCGVHDRNYIEDCPQCFAANELSIFRRQASNLANEVEVTDLSQCKSNTVHLRRTKLVSRLKELADW